MKNKKIISDACDEFLEDVLPDTAQAAQINDMRVAFMAGALTVFRQVMTNMDGEEEQTFKAMDVLYSEITEISAKFAQMGKTKSSFTF